MQRLLADYYGVEVDEQWLEGQGVDVALLAHPAGAAEAPTLGEGAARGVSNAAEGTAREQFYHEAAVPGQEVQDARAHSVAEGGGSAGGGSDLWEGKAQSPDTRPKPQRRGGVLGFLGM